MLAAAAVILVSISMPVEAESPSATANVSYVGTFEDGLACATAKGQVEQVLHANKSFYTNLQCLDEATGFPPRN